MRGRHAAGAVIIVLFFAATRPLLAQASSHPAQTSKPAVAPSAAFLKLPPETRGDVLMGEGRYVDAIKAYREAPTDSPTVWNKMGIAWQHLYAVDKAKLDYERALRLKPRYPEALNNLGTIYYEKKDYKKAEKLYRKALKLSKPDATFYNNLGAAYFAQGNYRKGAEAYQRAFAINPAVFIRNSSEGISELGSPAQQANQNYCLAELYAQAGMTDRAMESLRRALDEGFNDRRRLMKDHSFTSLRKTAAFAQLMKQMK
ncbi:MAG: tetratricopeptide repeat protein [Acidobacteriota bacterium]|nr:tetratricopeptide repeat protein [Acidobacteriota bacterium]